MAAGRGGWSKEDGLLISQPKTKSSIRTISLPPPLLTILKEYKESVNSRWLFPSPVKKDSPLDLAHIRTRLHLILEHAQCKQIRFHNLRHTFATMALGSGMDVKTLSAMLGYVPAATTLDIYTHITNPMRSEAAEKIDQRIAKAGPREKETTSEQKTETVPQPFAPSFPTTARSERPTAGVSPRSANTAGRAATLRFGRAARSAPAMCTPKPGRSASPSCLD